MSWKEKKVELTYAEDTNIGLAMETTDEIPLPSLLIRCDHVIYVPKYIAWLLLIQLWLNLLCMH